MNGDLTLSRRMYAEPDVRELLEAIPSLTAQLSASLDALRSDPSPSRCADLALTLYGAQTHVQRLRMAVERST